MPGSHRRRNRRHAAHCGSCSALLLFFDRGWLTQVIGAVCLAAADEAVEFRITGYTGDFLLQTVAPQHAEMFVLIRPAVAF